MPREPARIFVNSMSDIEWWETEWIKRVLRRIRENPKHTFLFLTKDPDVYPIRTWPDNCWLGMTATTMDEIEVARRALINPNIQFISVEPLMERIEPRLIGGASIDWVILGAETGNRAGRVIPPAHWIAPWLGLSIPLFMKDNLPWPGERRREYPE
jgi:protein gp37